MVFLYIYIMGYTSNTFKFIIANKRFKESNKAFVCLTAGYGGKFFNIAKSQVISKKDSHIKINDVYNEPATEFIVTKFMYDCISANLKNMAKHDLVSID